MYKRQEETRAYYDSLFDKIDRGNMDWGVFTASLPDRNEDAFAAVRERVIDTLSWICLLYTSKNTQRPVRFQTAAEHR